LLLVVEDGESVGGGSEDADGENGDEAGDYGLGEVEGRCVDLHDCGGKVFLRQSYRSDRGMDIEKDRFSSDQICNEDASTRSNLQVGYRKVYTEENECEEE